MYISDLESRLVNAEAANNSLQRKNVALAETKSALERDLDDKELQINAHKRDQQKSSRKLKTQLSQQEVIFRLFELYLKSNLLKIKGVIFEWPPRTPHICLIGLNLTCQVSELFNISFIYRVSHSKVCKLILLW